MGLTHRLKPGDTITVGDNITFRVLECSYGTNIRVDVDAPRSIPIAVRRPEIRRKPQVQHNT